MRINQCANENTGIIITDTGRVWPLSYISFGLRLNIHLKLMCTRPCLVHTFVYLCSYLNAFLGWLKDGADVANTVVSGWLIERGMKLQYTASTWVCLTPTFSRVKKNIWFASFCTRLCLNLNLRSHIAALLMCRRGRAPRWIPLFDL